MTILPMHDSMSLGSKCPYVLHALSANCYYIYSQKQSWEKGQCKKKKDYGFINILGAQNTYSLHT